MYLINNASRKRLQIALADFLRGKPLEKWAENRILDLLKQVGQFAPPVSLDDSKLRSDRKITSFSVAGGYLPEHGRLERENRGFRVHLGTSRKRWKHWFRVNLAHEIVHTLFYDLNATPPRQLTIFPPGDPDLESLCRYMALVLLMPETWLAKLSFFEGARHSLLQMPELIDNVTSRFLVPREIAAARIAHILGNLVFVILRFEKTKDRSGDGSSWKLVWHERSPNAPSQLFIPFPRKRNGLFLYPRCKPPLDKFLTEMEQLGMHDKPFNHTISLNVLNTATTGNLGRLLQERSSQGHLEIICRLEISPWTDIFEDNCDTYEVALEVYIPFEPGGR